VKPRMNREIKIGLVLVIVVAVALLSALWATRIEPVFPPPAPFEPRRFPTDRIRGDIELFYTAKTVISSVNITLLVILLIAYISIYKKTHSEFTVGLIIFSLTLLFYAFTSNPITYWAFGFRAFGLGPFAMLPDLFTSMALAVLLYLTVKY